MPCLSISKDEAPAWAGCAAFFGLLLTLPGILAEWFGIQQSGAASNTDMMDQLVDLMEETEFGEGGGFEDEATQRELTQVAPHASVHARACKRPHAHTNVHTRKNSSTHARAKHTHARRGVCARVHTHTHARRHEQEQTHTTTT